MKKNIFLSFIISLFCVFSIQGQNTTIIDDNFENYLETHNANGVIVNLGDVDSMGDGIANNNTVLTDRISNVVTLGLVDLEITNLDGIEEFVDLETFFCNDNALLSVDLSSNVNLKFLNISNNRIEDLDISNNLNLESLFCSSNQISSLNLMSNTVLKNLDVSNNLLSVLNLSAINTKVCPDPQTNPLTPCQGLGSINVSNNELSSLIVSNGFNDLITTFNSNDNLDLFCITVDGGFTPDSNWQKDDWTYYGETVCADIYTYVPDDNFEAYLEANGLGDDVADNNFVLTSRVTGETTLSITSQNIEGLEGIEDFISLKVLDCSDNNLKSLNLENNIALLEINCSSNFLPALNLSSNAGLTSLNCASQKPYIDLDDTANDYTFSQLNVSDNTALVSLDCSGNTLSNLDVSNNVLLTDLDCSNNNIPALNVNLNTGLVNFYCNDNSLLTLSIKNGNNSVLTNFDVHNNLDLVCIEVDNPISVKVGWLKDTSASYNDTTCGTYVPDDAFENYLEAEGLGDGIANNNFVSTADVNAFAGTLTVSNLGISDLTGIEAFVALKELDCSNNNLSSLDLSTNIALTTLDCASNQIEDIDLTLNVALTSLTCNDNLLFTLNIKNGNNTNLSAFDAINNSNLFCINVDDITFAESATNTNWNKDDIANYNEDCYTNRFTDIPDVNFEQALVDLGIDTTPNDNRVLTSNIEHLLSLNVTNKQIESLEGIEAFSLLEELDCSNNYLSDLDVSSLVYLKNLYCTSNDLSGLLNIDGITNLVNLFCADNNLSDLDLSLNINLEELDCSNNSLISLDISNNNNLIEVNCNNNQISSLLVNESLDNSTLTTLSCNGNEIVGLALNRYLELTTLNCRSNALTMLDITSNVDLQVLDFSVNTLADVVFSNNTNLISVSGSQNQLANVSTLASVSLESLILDDNEITAFTVLNSLTTLKYLSANNNQLSGELNVNNNTNLIELSVNNNTISSINLPVNLNQLKTFNCSNNAISGGFDLTSMGISPCPIPNENNPIGFCPESISINVSNNQLEFLNLQNGINEDISSLNATSNSGLTCIQVDDASNIGTSWFKDVITAYNVECKYGETYVPDDNFEQALISLGYDTGALDDYVPTVSIEALLSLDVSGNTISDLTGIEDFTALQNLNISNNNLSVFDLTENENLTVINCSNNVFSNIDFSKSIALTSINCSGNMLTNLDLTKNVNVTILDISTNLFTEFAPAEIVTLQEFNCDSNSLVALDLSSNLALTNLSCESNVLERLSIANGQNPNIISFSAQNNTNLTCIETDSGTVPAGVSWLKDTIVEYAIDCHYGESYVPDDAFEQALINMGIDATGILDDYVSTVLMNSLSTLNINNQGIVDLTGIEVFTNLTTLDFSENLVENVDLSSNVLLTSLIASNNNLMTIDVSPLSGLSTIDLSSNSLIAINLTANTNLLDLNLSDNELSILNVDSLISLELLRCSENLLTVLSIAENENLIELHCESNQFVQDQLNLQNGNNPNLSILNALNNPDLECILVDDPFEVLSNVGGLYTNWDKDATANYQFICIDADNDGVANAEDQCPNTSFGTSVDLFGCPILDITDTNFTILVTDETCLNVNNGKINISTLDYYNYQATLIGENFSRVYDFTNEIDILNLLAGDYELCLTIQEWPNYISCYNITIRHPEGLNVLTNKSAKSKELSIELSGSTNYNIDFNGLAFSTNESELTLQLRDGNNAIKVSTDAVCQGIYEENILVSDVMSVYPNPFQEDLNVILGNLDEDITIKIHTYLGQLIYSKTYVNPKSTYLNIDTNNFPTGFYTLSIETEKSVSIFKIIK